MPSVIDRLKQRRVVQWTLAYLAAAWLLFQLLQSLGEPWGIGDGLLRRVQLVILAGLPVVLVTSWFHGARGRQRVRVVEIGTFACVSVAVAAAVLVPMAPGDPPADPHAIAVLPFSDFSEAGDQAFLGAGVAEELMHLLSQVPELRVTSRTSSFAFEDRSDLTLPEIAEHLGVETVLEGSVRRIGDEIRIGVQLVGADDVRILSRSYEAPAGNLLGLQDSVAADVVESLLGELAVTPAATDRLDPETHRLFLLGRYIARQRAEGWEERAAPILEQVLEREPTHVPTLLELALVHLDAASASDDPAAARERALRYTERALDVDSLSARAHGVLSGLLHPHDLEGMARAMTRALELAPRDPEILMWAGITLQLLARDEEAIPFLEFKARADPLDRITHSNLAIAYHNAERWDDAARAWRTVGLISPGAGEAAVGLSLALAGRTEEAREVLEAAGEGFGRDFGLAVLADRAGRTEEVDRWIADLQASGESPTRIALAAGVTRNADLVFETVAEMDTLTATVTSLFLPIAGRPEFAWLSGDPRWTAFLARVGQSPEVLAAVAFDPVPPR